jgi:YVTN family beta-propeller protein
VAGADGTVYVTNSLDDTVSVIPAGADATSETVPSGDDPGRMAVRRDGSVVVVNRGDKSLTVIEPPTAAPATAASLEEGAAGGAGAGGAASAADPANPGAVLSLPVMAGVAGGLVLCAAAAVVLLLRRRAAL